MDNLAQFAECPRALLTARESCALSRRDEDSGRCYAPFVMEGNHPPVTPVADWSPAKRHYTFALLFVGWLSDRLFATRYGA